MTNVGTAKLLMGSSTLALLLVGCGDFEVPHRRKIDPTPQIRLVPDQPPASDGQIGLAKPDGGAAPLPPDGGGSPAGSCGMVDREQQLFDLLNAARTAAGKKALACDPAAVKAARAHCQDMCDHNYLGHQGSDGSWPNDRLAAAGAKFGGFGENAAWNMAQVSAKYINDHWDAAHQAVRMDGSFRRAGIGVAVCGSKSYWTEDFMD